RRDGLGRPVHRPQPARAADVLLPGRSRSRPGMGRAPRSPPRLQCRASSPAAADAENEANEPLDPEVRAEVELAMASAREQIISDGREPTLGEVVQLAAKTRPDLPEPALQRVAVEVLAAQNGSSGAEAREAIREEVSKG